MEVYAARYSCGYLLLCRVPTPTQQTESPSFKSSNAAINGTDPWTRFSENMPFPVGSASAFRS